MHLQKLSILALLLFSYASFAQKPPLNHDVYDGWQSVVQPNLSRSGHYIFYVINPQEGDGVLEIKTKDNIVLAKIPRGSNPTLSYHENVLVTKIKPLFQETRQAKIEKKKGDDLPQDSLAVLNLKSGTLRKFENAISYKIPLQNDHYFAFLTSAVKNAKDTVAKDSIEHDKPKRSAKDDKGNKVLHVYDTQSGDTVNFDHVQEYAWSDDGKFLAFSVKNKSSDSLTNNSGVFVYRPVDKVVKQIFKGKGDFNNFSFTNQSSKLVFLGDTTGEKSLLKDYKVYLYAFGADSASALVTKDTQGIPEGWYVSGDGRLEFSENGQKLYFGVAPIPMITDTSLVEFEHAKVDIWHWKDDYLQPQQLVNLKRDRAKNYPAVIDFSNSGKIIPLADDKFNRSITTDDKNNEWVVVTSDFGNRISSQWELGTKSDVFIVSAKTGGNRKIVEALDGNVFLSPSGSYVVYFNAADSSWNSYNIAEDKHHALTSGLASAFVDEENDQPAFPRAYGFGAWSENGSKVYVYDRYDVWCFDLKKNEGVNLTNGYGRKNRIELRLQDLKPRKYPSQRTFTIGTNGDVLLKAFDEVSKESGVFKLKSTIKPGDPIKFVMDAKQFRLFAVDEGSKSVLYSKEDYQHSPNLFLNTSTFNQERQFTEINSQQNNFNWGTAELVKWTTPHGYHSEGILYKPENFDPSKKYPVIAYFYERLSDGLYSYQSPAPTPSRLNIPYFVSNEFLVFAPDIRYEIGYPGKSAEEFINSGMQYLVDTYDFVDSTKLGIQGQSWGGYQVAHLITRTNMYAAAWTGAPVVNMTSAYGGIRWGSGMSRQFQYEKTQSRIGKTLWEDLDLYIENSPLFFMDKVETPVVIMANDNDGAVPWYQGIEMFTALRRLQKPVWLLNYNGDEHNLMERQNRKDIQQREFQFFDHFLRGGAEPKWISEGVPALHKGIDWGL